MPDWDCYCGAELKRTSRSEVKMFENKEHGKEKGCGIREDSARLVLRSKPGLPWTMPHLTLSPSQQTTNQFMAPKSATITENPRCARGHLNQLDVVMRHSVNQT